MARGRNKNSAVHGCGGGGVGSSSSSSSRPPSAHGPAVRSATSMGAGVCSGLVLVCDLDSTLVERPQSGLYPTLEESPCHQPVLEWLQEGGRILLNTTAGRRPIRQFWNAVPQKHRLRNQVAMATCTGAALAVAHPKDGSVVYSGEYMQRAVEGGTYLSQAQVDLVTSHVLRIVRRLYADMAADPSLIRLLSDKYQVPFRELCKRISQNPGGADAVVTLDLLTTPGAVLFETNEILLSASRVPAAATATAASADNAQKGAPEAASTSETHVASSVSGSCDGGGGGSGGDSSSISRSGGSDQDAGGMSGGACAMTLMGVPHAVSEKYFGKLRDLCSRHGVEVSFAPNSAWFYKLGVNKAAPICWLLTHGHGEEKEAGSRGPTREGEQRNEPRTKRAKRGGLHSLDDGKHGGARDCVEVADGHGGECNAHTGGECGAQGASRHCQGTQRSSSGDRGRAFCCCDGGWGESTLDPRCALAIGDSPHSNDGPMAAFRHRGMEFVSVAGRLDAVPADLQPLHVGGKEDGAARFIAALIAELRSERQRQRQGSGDGERTVDGRAERGSKRAGHRASSGARHADGSEGSSSRHHGQEEGHHGRVRCCGRGCCWFKWSGDAFAACVATAVAQARDRTTHDQ